MAAFTWAIHASIFDLKTVRITGNSILTMKEIEEIADLKPGYDILQIDLSLVQKQIEANPYVKAALVSRQFPNQINIQIVERIPICYFNQKQIYLLDTEGILLPLPKQNLAFNFPVITGFERDKQPYVPGQKVPNMNIINALNLIKKSMLEMPQLYNEISTLNFQSNGEFVIFTNQGGTQIYLGKEALIQKLYSLSEFQSRIRKHHQLRDYRYLDLRWRTQIVAMEKA
jgi:cell division protein FtsQ